jgi:hypothetical protein
MPITRRRSVNQIFDPVLTAQVTGAGYDELVYFLVANRPYRYPRESSRIVYIGTTAAGLWRISSSASERIYNGKNELHGFKRLDAYVIWSRTKRGPQTYQGRPIYKILERAALIVFRETCGTIPILNGNGSGIRTENEFVVFARKRIERIVGR